MFRRTYVAYTLFNGNVCNKKCSLDSAVQFIQQTKKNNGSTCTTCSKCDTRAVILTTGIMAAFMAAMTFYPSGSTVNHFYDAYYTSNNHTIRAPNELGGGGGHTTSQAICTATCKNVHGNFVTGDDIDCQGLCQEGQNQGTVKKNLV